MVKAFWGLVGFMQGGGAVSEWMEMIGGTSGHACRIHCAYIIGEAPVVMAPKTYSEDKNAGLMEYLR